MISTRRIQLLLALSAKDFCVSATTAWNSLSDNCKEVKLVLVLEVEQRLKCLTKFTKLHSSSHCHKAPLICLWCMALYKSASDFMCKVNASHTRYWALGPELIPVYRQSAHPAVGCHYFLPGLQVTFPAAEHHRPLAGTINQSINQNEFI